MIVSRTCAPRQGEGAKETESGLLGEDLPALINAISLAAEHHNAYGQAGRLLDIAIEGIRRHTA